MDKWLNSSANIYWALIVCQSFFRCWGYNSKKKKSFFANLIFCIQKIQSQVCKFAQQKVCYCYYLIWAWFCLFFIFCCTLDFSLVIFSVGSLLVLYKQDHCLLLFISIGILKMCESTFKLIILAGYQNH